MRLWIDVREACREKKTGKGQWTYRCVSALLALPGMRATLLTDARLPTAWIDAPGIEAVRASPAGFRWHLAAAKLLKREKANLDAYLAPTSFIVPFLVGKAVPTVPVVHDLIAFRNEPHDRKAVFVERLTLRRALRDAKAVCAVSDATADAVRMRFGSGFPITTVGAGPTVDETGTWTGGGGHVLCIATLCPRKNQLRLVRAFAALPEATRGTLKLVGGRGWDDDAIVRAAKETPGVEWLGFRSQEECAALLRTCEGFAYVSEEEGFGLPVLDALRVGAPTLAADIPVFREVAGDAALYADPLDEASIARGLERLLGEDASERRAAGVKRAGAFSWENTADAVLAACGGRR